MPAFSTADQFDNFQRCLGFYFAVCLVSYRSQMTSKCGRDEKVARRRVIYAKRKQNN